MIEQKYIAYTFVFIALFTFLFSYLLRGIDIILLQRYMIVLATMQVHVLNVSRSKSIRISREDGEGCRLVSSSEWCCLPFSTNLPAPSASAHQSRHA